MTGYREDHERYHKHGPSTDDEPRLSIEELGRAVHEGGPDLLAATVAAMLPEWCAEPLADGDFRAICTRPWGSEHSHHDHTAREAVASGIALEGCYDCAGQDGDPDRRACSNCDREFHNV